MAAIILALCPIVFVLARFATLDPALAFFLTAAMGAFYFASMVGFEGRTGRAWMLAAAGLLALGTLTKGPVALILAAACLLASCAKPDRNFALPAASEPKLELTTPADIATGLVKGGYILYMRHGETIREQGEIEAANR